MELIGRYLQAIEFWLPKRQKQDIIAELSEDLHSQVEEKEAELGRKLNDGEVEAILKRCGSPLVVASRYRPQQYLIGPTLFPIYLFALAVLTAGCVIPRFLIWLGFLLIDPAHRGYLHMENMGSTVFYFASLTTLAFAIGERTGAKFDWLADYWNPRKLPPLRNPNQIPRSNSLFEIAGLTLLNVWLISVLWPRPVIDFYNAKISIAPTWKIIFWSLLSITVVDLCISVVNFFRPFWTRLRSALSLLMDSLGAAIFCWSLRSHLVAGIAVPGLSSAKADALTNWINAIMANTFWYAVAVSVVILAFNLRRYTVRFRDRQLHASGTQAQVL
jgi:hypothetical protein